MRGCLFRCRAFLKIALLPSKFLYNHSCLLRSCLRSLPHSTSCQEPSEIRKLGQIFCLLDSQAVRVGGFSPPFQICLTTHWSLAVLLLASATFYSKSTAVLLSSLGGSHVNPYQERDVNGTHNSLIQTSAFPRSIWFTESALNSAIAEEVELYS